MLPELFEQCLARRAEVAIRMIPTPIGPTDGQIVGLPGVFHFTGKRSALVEDIIMSDPNAR